MSYLYTPRKTVCRITVLVLLVALLLPALVSCGQETSVGVTDGVMELDGATVDFGGNTMADDAESTLSRLRVNASDRPDGLGSDLLELNLDAAYDAPVTVRIPVSDTTPPEDGDAVLMLGIGTEVIGADGSVEMLYQYIPADLEDETAVASFIPEDYAGGWSAKGSSFDGSGAKAAGTKASGARLRFGIFWISTYFEEGGHFLVHFPTQRGSFFLDYTTRETLLTDLEAVYNTYIEKGYTYSKREEWPLEVTIQAMDDVGCYSYGWDAAGGSICLNRSLFENGYQAAAVRNLLAHEFFHFVQANYVGSDSDLLWFDEATATYFEWVSGGGIPSIVAEYEEKIFSGVYPEDNSAADGYARMPLVRHLAQRLGEDFIRNAYETAAAGADWDSALLSSIGPPSGWATEFYTALVRGDVSSFAPYTLHTNLADGGMGGIGTSLELKVPDAADIVEMLDNDEVPQLGSTTVSVGPYGAQLVALTIDEDNLKKLADGMDPTVAVSDGELRVLAARGKTVTEMAGGMLSGFKALTEDQNVFLAVVVGQHDSGTKDISLSVEIAPYPLLEELVGPYDDGSMTFTDVFVSESLMASAADSESGCDAQMLATIQGMEGQEQPSQIRIEQTGTNTGHMIMVDEDGEPSDPLPFTYMNGQLTFDYADEGAELSGSLAASYGPDKTVVLDGNLQISAMGGELTIDVRIRGTKPLTTP